ncbi:MAG: HAD family hydrolase, partial [Verrucomicrobiota bacterium]
TTSEFEEIAREWIQTARNPETGLLFTEMVYQPMLELLDYLRENDFETWIVSGGGIDFLRPWSAEIYGIPPQQVIGSSVRTSFAEEDGEPILLREAEIDFVNDKEGKPVGIQRHIGKKPIFASGNSDGDFQMLQYTTSGDSPSFGILLHHTDAEREWAYDRNSEVGKLDRGLDEAGERGWMVIDMAEDWNTVFPRD